MAHARFYLGGVAWLRRSIPWPGVFLGHVGCSDESPDFSSRTSTFHFNLTRIVQWRSRRRVRFKLRWRQRHTLLGADGYSARSGFAAFRSNLCRDGHWNFSDSLDRHPPERPPEPHPPYPPPQPRPP